VTSPLVVTIANIKGGVGKTTTGWMLARHLVARRSVLLVDMDPHAHLTRATGVAANTNIGHVLGGANNPSASLRSAARIGNHDIPIVPANLDLANVAHGLHNRMFDRFNALANAIAATGSDWHTIIIDAPANADILTINALAAANTVVIPCQPEPASIEALRATIRLIDQVRQAMHRADEPCHLRTVITLADERTNQHRDGIQRIQETAPNYTCTIPRRNGESADADLFAAYAPLATSLEEIRC